MASTVTFMGIEHTECLKAVTMKRNLQPKAMAQKGGWGIHTAATSILFGKVFFFFFFFNG